MQGDGLPIGARVFWEAACLLLLMSANYLHFSWRLIAQSVVCVVCSLYASSCFLSFIQDEEGQVSPKARRKQILNVHTVGV